MIHRSQENAVSQQVVQLEELMVFLAIFGSTAAKRVSKVVMGIFDKVFQQFVKRIVSLAHCNPWFYPHHRILCRFLLLFLIHIVVLTHMQAAVANISSFSFSSLFQHLCDNMDCE